MNILTSKNKIYFFIVSFILNTTFFTPNTQAVTDNNSLDSKNKLYLEYGPSYANNFVDTEKINQYTKIGYEFSNNDG